MKTHVDEHRYTFHVRVRLLMIRKVSDGAVLHFA